MIKQFVIVLLVLTLSMIAQCQGTVSDSQGSITPSEAKSLLAQTPEFLSMKTRGWTYYFDLQKPDVGFNGVDFYFFEIFARKKGERDSDLVGHFAVNKWTGELRDISSDEQGRAISFPSLKNMQTELQQRHHISQRKLEEERNAHTVIIKK